MKTHSVFPLIISKGGGVHLWYKTFSQQGSISKFVSNINVKIKGAQGNTMLPSFRGNTEHISFLSY